MVEVLEREIIILGKYYRVLYAEPALTGGNMGNARRSEGVISIDSTNTPAQQLDTLVHEVLHMIDGELAIGLEEKDIQRLAVGLTSAGLYIPVYAVGEARK